MTTALTPALKLPSVIADLDLVLARAISTNPPREIWPEGEPFTKAEQPEAIAKILVRSKLHERLVNARLCYLFRKNINSAGRVRLCVSSAPKGKLLYLTQFDFIVEFNHELWRKLTNEQRVACVDHALTACERDLETGAYFVELPDVAEFSAVVGRWGLWTPPLRGFGVAIETSQQFELFVPMGQFEPAEEEKPAQDLAESERNRVKKGGR